MSKIKLIISYDGSKYFGWQKTSLDRLSIEGELEKAAEKIFGQPTQFEAASRTDRGVHAKGQTVHFSVDLPVEPRRLLRSLNAVLPRDLSVLAVEEVPETFHATLDARGKEYHYYLCTSPVQLPMHRLYSWHIPQPLNLIAMQEAAKHLLGTHDFSSLTNERTDDAIRTLTSVQIIPLEDRLCIEMKGDRFLYKMARNIAGTLVSIGCGKIANTIPEILASRDRTKAGVTAPAHGLFLIKVFYDLAQ